MDSTGPPAHEINCDKRNLVLSCITTFLYYNVRDASTCTDIGMLGGRRGEFGCYQ